MTSPVDPLLLGDKLARPLNAPSSAALTPGVQPGVSGAVVTANRVVIFGDNGELLVYSGSPQFGNLLASISGISTTDPYGNFVVAGITLYGDNGSAIQMYLRAGNPVLFLLPPGAASLTVVPEMFAAVLGPGAVSEVAALILQSGKENGGDDAALQLFSEAADASAAARAVIEFGGFVSVTVTAAGMAVTGFVQPGNGSSAGAHIYSGSGAPGLTAVAGDLYIRTNGGAGTYLYRCTGGAAWTAFA